MEHQYLPTWTQQEIDYLKERYLITSFVEFAKVLDKDPAEVQQMLKKLGLIETLIQSAEPHLRIKLSILRLMQEHKRYLPNGWLVGLSMSNLMMRSLVRQIQNGDTWIEEVDEEINSVLDAIVGLFELTPLLDVGDMLKGEDHGQAYRITGREFVPSDRWITYYFTYLYGGQDIPEEYEDDWDDDDDEDSDDDQMQIILHKN